MRNNAKNGSDRLDKQMIKSYAKKHLYMLYEIGDKVYVRWKKEKGKKKSTKHTIKVGLVIKRYLDDTNYDIKTEGPVHQLMKKVKIEYLAVCPWEKQSKPYPLLIPINHD